jgi:aldose 1-epimerase
MDTGMTRYGTEERTREGERLIRLADTQTGAWAEVWPALGNNCVAAHVADPRREHALVNLLLAPPSLADLRENPSRWGIPLLFPFPSRMAGGVYTFEGKRRAFRREGHGFALERPWRVVSTEAGPDAATVTSVLEPADVPDTREEYPFPFRVEATYALDAEGLRLTLRVRNTGDGPLPFGYGAHPYFQLPVGESDAGRRDACRLRVPAARRWNGEKLRAVSEGVVAPWEELCPPVPAELDLRSGPMLLDRQLDGVWTEMELVNGLVECAVEDPASGLAAVMRATPNHPNVTVFTPPWGDGVCFEPWTCPPNAFNLAAHGVPDHGLTVLQPGEVWEGTMWLGVRRLES